MYLTDSIEAWVLKADPVKARQVIEKIAQYPQTGTTKVLAQAYYSGVLDNLREKLAKNIHVRVFMPYRDITSLFVLLEKFESELLIYQADSILLTSGQDVVLNLRNSKLPASGRSFSINMHAFRNSISDLVWEETTQREIATQSTDVVIVVTMLCSWY